MRKTLEDFNFKQYGQYDVDPVKTHIDNFSDEWFINTSRQDNYYVHKDTNSYFVYTTSLEWKEGQDFLTNTTSNDSGLLELLEPIISDLEKLHDGTRGMVLLIKLKAGQDIAPHKDSGDYLMLSRRHHIPVVTTPDVFFGVGDELVNMNTGECWEINNSRVHSVNNNSSIDRVHLLIDIMPNEEIGKK
jgi:quercetin dioxygenase-like cupin family protein